MTGLALKATEASLKKKVSLSKTSFVLNFNQQKKFFNAVKSFMEIFDTFTNFYKQENKLVYL